MVFSINKPAGQSKKKSFLEGLKGSEVGDATAYSFISRIEDGLQEKDMLPKGHWQEKDTPSPYNAIIKECEEVLKNESKDYNVLFFWIEAVIAHKGLGELALCLKQLLEFSKIFFKSAYPKDVDDKKIAFEKGDLRISRKLATAKMMGEIDFSLLDYMHAVRMKNKSMQTEDPKAFIASELPENKTMQFFEDQFDKISIAEKQTVCNMLKRSQILLKELEEFFNMREIGKVVKQLLENVFVMDGDHSNEGENLPEAKMQNTASGAIHTRKDAYTQLRKISTFLIQNEPHAFTGYILGKLASMEEKPIAVLLKEFPELQGLMK